MSKEKQLGSGLERRVVDRAQKVGLEAHTQPGSGVYAGYPNDAVIESVLVECKVRSAKLDIAGDRWFQVNLDWFRNVRRNAQKAGFEEGVLVINAKGDQAPSVLVDLNFFLSLLASRKHALTDKDS